MAWFSLAKIALQAGGKIYANRQKAKVAMSDAQLLHAERQARGEEAYQGKLLEARQTDLKDEFVLVILSAPIIILAWGVFSDSHVAHFGARLGGLVGRSGRYDQDKSFLRTFQSASYMVYKFMDSCLRQHFWYKGNTNIS